SHVSSKKDCASAAAPSTPTVGMRRVLTSPGLAGFMKTQSVTSLMALTLFLAPANYCRLPSQEDPHPAVHPKQWRPVKILSPSTSPNERMVQTDFSPIPIPSIWLKSQS